MRTKLPAVQVHPHRSFMLSAAVRLKLLFLSEFSLRGVEVQLPLQTCGFFFFRIALITRNVAEHRLMLLDK